MVETILRLWVHLIQNAVRKGHSSFIRMAWEHFMTFSNVGLDQRGITVIGREEYALSGLSEGEN